jgi:hypothetical protein
MGYAIADATTAQLVERTVPMNVPVFLLIAVVLPVSLMVISLGIFLIARALSSVGSGGTGVRAPKGLLGAEQVLAARWLAIPERLSGPVDLEGPSLRAAIVRNPLIGQIAEVIGVIQLARVVGGSAAPRQLVSQRLAETWGGMSKLPLGQCAISELHARPLLSGSGADRMLVWFAARIGLGTPFTEYWTFVSTAVMPGLPAKCPNCGAPTTGSTSGVCAYCHLALSQASRSTPETPALWVVDDITTTPPASAAA